MAAFQKRLALMNNLFRGNLTLLKNALGLFTTRVGNAVLTFALMLILAKLLGPSQLGVYSMNMALVMIFSTIAVFGFDQYLVRHISVAVSLEKPRQASGLLWRTIQLVCVFSVFWISMLAISLVIIEPINLKSHAIALALIPILSILRVLFGAMLGHGHALVCSIPEYVLLTGFHLVAIVVFTFGFAIELQAEEALLWRVLAGIAALFAAGIIFAKVLDRKYWRHYVVKNLPNWRHEAAALFGVQLLTMLFLQIDVVMLGIIASNKDVGVYQFAMQFVLAAILPSWAIAQALAPQFSKSHEGKKIEKFQNQLIFGTRLAFFLSAPIFLTLLIFALPLLKLLGFAEEYSRSATIISIVSLGWMASLLIGPAGTALMMSGQARILAKAFAAAVLFRFLIGLPLIRYFDAEGAAVANAVSIVVLQILLYACLKRTLGLRATIY